MYQTYYNNKKLIANTLRLCHLRKHHLFNERLSSLGIMALFTNISAYLIIFKINFC